MSSLNFYLLSNDGTVPTMTNQMDEWTPPSPSVKLSFTSSSTKKSCSRLHRKTFNLGNEIFCSAFYTLMILFSITIISTTSSNECFLSNLESGEFRVQISDLTLNRSICTICTCTKAMTISCKPVALFSVNGHEKPLCNRSPLSMAEKSCCSLHAENAKKVTNNSPLNGLVVEPWTADVPSSPQTVASPSSSVCIQKGQKYAEGQFFWKRTLNENNSTVCTRCNCMRGAVFCVPTHIQRHGCCPCNRKDDAPNKPTSFLQLDTQENSSPNTFLSNPVDMATPSLSSSSSSSKSSSSLGVLLFKLHPLSESNRKTFSCTSNGRSYENGAKWNPVLGIFGTIRCVVCKCQNGIIECYRKIRPLVEQNDAFPSVRPKKVRRTAVRRSFLKRCLPPKTDTLVFQASLENSQSFQFAFKAAFKPQNKVRLSTYSAEDQRWIRFNDKSLDVNQFEEEVRKHPAHYFKFVGVTRKRAMENFLSLVANLTKNCQTLGCKLSLKDLIGQLELRPLNNDERICDPSRTLTLTTN